MKPKSLIAIVFVWDLTPRHTEKITVDFVKFHAKNHANFNECHARMREILSYLHIPKTTSMCYVYEANYSD